MAWYHFGFKKDGRSNNELSEEQRIKALETRRANAELAAKKLEFELETVRLTELKKQRELELSLAQVEQQIEELSSSNVCPHGCDDNTFCSICDAQENLGGMSEEGMITMRLLDKFLPDNRPAAAKNSNTSPIQTQDTSISDDDLKKMWADVSPMYKKIAANMSDDDLRAFMIGRDPSINADTVRRAITIIRNSSSA